MEALNLLQKGTSVSERASEFASSIKRNIQRDILDKLAESIEKIDDKLYSEKDFSLQIDLNKGQVGVSREDCEARFKSIIKLEYERELLERELKIKQASFDKYFSDGQIK